MGRADEARLTALATEVAQAAGFDLEELTVVAAGRRRLVRVVIDADNGVPLDDAAAVSRALAELLDAQDEDPMGPAPYTLEVTSPGIGRPLTAPRHFRRSRGRLVALTLTDGSSVTGRIRRVVDETLELLIDRASHVVPMADIAKAKVEVEFNGIPKADAAILAADAEGAVGENDTAALPSADAADADDNDVDDSDADDERTDDEETEDDDDAADHEEDEVR